MRRLLAPPWPAVFVAVLVFSAGLVLLVVGLRNPFAGGAAPLPRCRRADDCGGRTTCLPDRRCGFGGRLRFPVEVPSSGGPWSWLHVTLRDRDGEFPKRGFSWPFRSGAAFPDLADIPEGRWEAEFHASPRPSPDDPCAGDLQQVISFTVDRGMTRVDGAARRRHGPLQLAARVAQPPCTAGR